MDKSLEKILIQSWDFFACNIRLSMDKKETWILQMLKYLIDSRCLLIKGYYK